LLQRSIFALIAACVLANCARPSLSEKYDPDLKLCERDDADCSTEIIELDRTELFGGIVELCIGCTVQYMPPALLPLRSGKRDGRTLWALSDDYAYFSDRYCKFVVVPHGFVTDLASIPRLGRLAYNPANYAEAALVHDWLYAIGEPGKRTEADEMFRDILIETGRADSAQQLFRFTQAGGKSGYGLASDFAFWDRMEGVIDYAREKPSTGFHDKPEADELAGTNILWTFVEGKFVLSPDGIVPGTEHIVNCTPQ